MMKAENDRKINEAAEWETLENSQDDLSFNMKMY